MSDRALRTDYVPGIDGLRALAVLSVLLYHLNDALLPGGFTGVDVFFVISGYVIAKSLQADSSAPLGAFILGFYKRRILRLVPALLFFLITLSFACALFIPDAWLSAGNNETALWAFFGVSNFYLLHSADGYFSLRIPYNPFSHTWTLAVEEQFYVLFPVLFYLWLKRRMTWLLPTLALASLIVAAYQASASPLAAFYLLPARFWELAAGALLFQAQSRRLPWVPWLMPVGIALLAVGFLFARPASFPFPWALAPVAGTVLLIAGLFGGSRTGIQAVLESRLVTYLGRISYSLYLWHWGIFALFRWTVGISEPSTAGAALLLTLLLSAFSYHVVEEPFRRGAFWRRQPGWRIAAGGVAAVVVAHLAVTALYETRNSLGLNLSITTNQYDWSPYISRPASGSGKRLFVIGDSHAETYGNMAYLAAQRQGAEVSIFSRVGCPIANLRTTVAHTPPCRHIEEDVVSYLQANAKPGDAVLIASLRVPRLSEQSNAFDLEAQRRLWRHPARITERKQALDEAARFIEKLQAMELHVILDAPKPLFRAPPFRCMDWFNRSNPACAAGFEVSRELLLELREPVMASLRELERSHGVHVWDPFPTLCPGPTCSALDGQRPVFFDTDHLSGYGGRLLVDSFSAALAQIWKRKRAEGA